MKHVSGYEQHPSSEAECRPGWMFWIPPPGVGRRPGREPALQKERSENKVELLDGEYKKKAKGNVEKKNSATFI